MAYGATRYGYNNLITSTSMITADTQAGGAVTLAELTTGSGSAVMYAVGPYTGATDLIYYVIIDSITAGKSVGQATFKWRTNTTSGWEATGVTTSSTLISLNNGIQIAWNAGTGDDFALGDANVFYANADYGTHHLIDEDVNTIFRSQAVDNLVFDLGSAQQVTMFVLRNHNFVAGQTTLKLQANSSDSWGSPAYSQTLTITDPLVLYPSQTYRYWRLNPTDGSLSYCQIGELYLGTYLELTYPAWWGSQDRHGYVAQGNTSTWGVTRQQALAQQDSFTLKYSRVVNADVTSLVTMQQALVNSTTGKVSPLWVHRSYDETDTILYAHWMNYADFAETHMRSANALPDLIFQEQVNVRV